MNETKEQSIQPERQRERLPVVWEIAVVTKDQSSSISVVFPAKQALDTQEMAPVQANQE